MNRPLPIHLTAALVGLLLLADRGGPPVDAAAAARDRLGEMPREVELAFYRAGESGALDRWEARATVWAGELAALDRPAFDSRIAALRSLISACTRRLNRTTPADAPFEVDEALTRARERR